MIVLLSPAKAIDIDSADVELKMSTPIFQVEAEHIMDTITQLSIPELEKVLKTSYDLAAGALNMAYNFRNGPYSMAIKSFNGVAYKQLNAVDFTTQDLEFAQKTIRIGSGTYGILRPMDKMARYRLDLETIILLDGIKIKMQKYWRKKVTEIIFQEMNQSDGILLNLASAETSDVIDIKSFPEIFNVINARFLTSTNKGLRTVPSVHLKKCRGALAQFIVKNRCSKISDLSNFSETGMRFDSNMSDKNDIVFIYEKD